MAKRTEELFISTATLLMMSANQIAFYIGLFGSVHCIGMCGPLAFAITGLRNKWWLVIADKLVYNAGRVVSYTLLGYLIGLLGEQLWLAGLQQAVSIISGLLIVVAGFSRLFKARFTQSRYMPISVAPIRRMISYALNHQWGHFLVGVLNGFLPCGFVYLALAGAVNTSSAAASAQYMFWFGAGTFPLMLIATIGSGYVGPVFRRRINKGMPYLMICLGCWFLLRGLSLNIPYLSPARQQQGVAICH
ncbi:sulfite exporter TauE/SafE family protein [Mucilaginibacter sp. 14171R-50]|uniref:sulfite exporter TauE/SafE family protein n=1 Tax=Mucilaginibacter sp. 14171R-50 TaxID=2703789 RepID=UPI001EE4E3B9|nr:sulfite exporter TauE/SafE family protein [Mucilaginibacter sp. 14171R-50]